MRIAGLMVVCLALALSAHFGSTRRVQAQDAASSTVIQTPAGAFTELAENPRGFREFRREKDGAIMVLIPAGAFRKRVYVGDPLAQDETFSLETPAFLIDKYETTNAQVLNFLESQKELEVKGDEIFVGKTRLAKDHKWGLAIGKGEYAVREGYAKHPSVGTTGHLALAYAQWAGGDLPYGYEFEKAAAGETGQLFPWGDELPDRNLANYYLYGPRCTQPVGSYPDGASPYGVHDLAGNVYDRAYWFETERDIKPDKLPTMLKGGAWVSPHWANLRCVDRCAQDMDDAEGSVGFRVVIRGPEVMKAIGAESKTTLRVHDDVEAAFEEAQARNVPIFLFLCYETCGQCDRVRAQVFTDPEFIEYMNEHAVVLIGHDPGDGWQDPVEYEDASILFPDCRTENLAATFAHFCREVNTRKIPKAIYRFKISPGQFALNPHRELQEEPEHLLLQPEDAFPKGGGDVQKFIDAMKLAQEQLGTGLTRSEYVDGKDAPKTSWKPPVEAE